MTKKNRIKKQPATPRDLLLEIYTEELPADYLKPAATQLVEDIKALLAEKNIKFASADSYYTVRRLVAHFKSVDIRQPDRTYEKKGPRYDMAYRDGSLTDIGRAFVEKNSLAEKDVKIKDEKGQKYLFASMFEKGLTLKKILEESLPGIIAGIRFPKSMIWNDTGATFARPVRCILCMLAGKPVVFSFAGLKSGNLTRLHKFAASGKTVAVRDAAEYFEIMEKNGIILEQEKRKALIMEKASAMLVKSGLKIIPDPGLLEMLASSVEAPAVMKGEFDKRYLSLPKEVIITAMREHQRYFAVSDFQGDFTNRFVNVMDGEGKLSAKVAPRHSKVLFARLNDAEFFYKEDLKKPLEECVPRLKEAVFITGLGTMYEKMERLKMLAASSAGMFGLTDTSKLQLAAYLCKADLMTNMVGEKEYAGLRGFMGGVYLKKQGADEDVWKAVAEHYQPVMAGDRLPETETGTILSVLDKADNLTGFFIAGYKPTGSKDPYAVRRQAMNLIYMILEKRLYIDLSLLVYESALAYRKQMGRDTDINEIKDFLRQREINYLKEKGLDYDIVASVTSEKRICVPEDYEKAVVMAEARKSGAGFNDTIFALARLNNIIPAGFKPSVVNEEFFGTDEEKRIYQTHVKVMPAIDELMSARKYRECYALIESLKPEIGAFFEKVLVNVDDTDVRQNRLSLLFTVRQSLYKFADFSKIVVDRK